MVKIVQLDPAQQAMPQELAPAVSDDAEAFGVVVMEKYSGTFLCAASSAATALGLKWVPSG